MSAGGIVVGRPRPHRLEAMLRSAQASDLTYDHLGSTLAPSQGTKSLSRHELVLGRGDRDLSLATEGLRRWVCHAGIGARVHPGDVPIAVDSTLLVVLPAGPVSVVVPNRIVAVTNEPDRFGFAYGTLDGHQESGEESFLVERRADGVVVGTVTIDAVPATLGARLGRVAVERLQGVAANRYLASLRRYVQKRGR